MLRGRLTRSLQNFFDWLKSWFSTKLLRKAGREDQLAYWALSLLSLPPCPRADEPRMYSCNSKDAQVRASVVW